MLTFVIFKFTTMKDRLQQFLTLEQLSPSRLSEIIGIQRSGLSHILSGRNKPGFDFIQKLLQKFPTINAEWLITGKGKMYKDQHSPSEDLFLEPKDPVKKIETNIFNQEIPFPNPSENLINEKTCTMDGKKRTLMKMIFVYSDNTFVEYSPSKE